MRSLRKILIKCNDLPSHLWKEKTCNCRSLGNLLSQVNKGREVRVREVRVREILISMRVLRDTRARPRYSPGSSTECNTYLSHFGPSNLPRSMLTVKNVNISQSVKNFLRNL